MTSPTDAGSTMFTQLVSGPMAGDFYGEWSDFRFRLWVRGYPNGASSESKVTLHRDGSSLSSLAMLPARIRTGSNDYIEMEICKLLDDPGCDVRFTVYFYASDNGVPKRYRWCIPSHCIFNLDMTLRWTPVNIQPTAVEITPLPIVLNYDGQGKELFATAKDATGEKIPGLPISWSTSNPAVFDVASAGNIWPVGVGTAAVTAIVSGVSDSKTVTVNDRLQVDIVGPSTMKPNESCLFNALILSSDYVEPVTYSWTGPAGATGTGEQYLAPPSASTYNVTFRATDATGRTGSKTKTIRAGASLTSCHQFH